MPGEQKKVCIDVPYIDQSKLYPTGCESVSTVMLLRFLGIDITVDEFIEKYLEKKSFEERDGQVYGPDPHRYFCGSPYDDESFGCYAPVIREALEKIIGAEYTVTDETGMTTDELVEKYIDQGMPVIYWACINMRDPIVGPQWKLLASSYSPLSAYFSAVFIDSLYALAPACIRNITIPIIAPAKRSRPQTISRIRLFFFPFSPTAPSPLFLVLPRRFVNAPILFFTSVYLSFTRYLFRYLQVDLFTF